MTMGDIGILLFRILIVVAIVWFFFHGHNIVRFIAKGIRNMCQAIAGAFHEWVFVIDEILFGEDEDNGCENV